jgi:ribosomal protein L37E
VSTPAVGVFWWLALGSAGAVLDLHWLFTAPTLEARLHRRKWPTVLGVTLLFAGVTGPLFLALVAACLPARLRLLAEHEAKRAKRTYLRCPKCGKATMTDEGSGTWGCERCWFMLPSVFGGPLSSECARCGRQVYDEARAADGLPGQHDVACEVTRLAARVLSEEELCCLQEVGEPGQSCPNYTFERMQVLGYGVWRWGSWRVTAKGRKALAEHAAAMARLRELHELTFAACIFHEVEPSE